LLGSTPEAARSPPGLSSSAITSALDLDFRAVTNTLLLWADGNFDGSSQPEELRAANEVLTGITLGYTTCDKKDQFGTLLWMRGLAFDADEKEWSIYVVFPATQ
jgi:hypothetical protein